MLKRSREFMALSKNGIFKKEKIISNKIMVVILHSEQYPWNSIIREGQFKTWINCIDDKFIEVFYCFGKPPGNLIRILDRANESFRWKLGAVFSSTRNLLNKIVATPFQNYVPKIKEEVFTGAPRGIKRLNIKIPDMYLTTRWRQLAVMQFFLNKKDFDYLLFITSATYLNTERLRKVIQTLNDEYVYAGPVFGNPTEDQFVSGAQMLFNKKSVEILLRNKKSIPVELLNDLGLGVAFARIGIRPQNLSTLNLSDSNQLKEINQKELETYHHFRLKSFKDGKRNDVRLFHELHGRLT
jgi:hypothetical protein